MSATATSTKAQSKIMDIREEDRFKLDPAFVAKFVGKEPEFGAVGKITFKRTYARPLENGSTEEYWQTLERIVNGVYTVQRWHCRLNNLPWRWGKAQRSAQRMFRLMWDFKFLPGGRGLWMMGTTYVEERGSAALNNCFAPETRAWIDGRLMALGEVAEATKATEQKVSVLSGDGSWREARVMSFGIQPLRRVEFAPAGIRSNFRLSYNVTANHRWVLADGSETTALKVGDQVRIDPVAPAGSDSDAAVGFAHGLVFGDGTRHTYYPDRHIIRLCGKKDQAFLEHLERLPYHLSTVRHASANFDPIVTFVLPEGERSWKDLPADSKSPAYQAAFLKGWIAADGSKKPNGADCLNSQNSEAIAWVIERAPLLGFCITGLNYDPVMETNYGRRSAQMARVTLIQEAVNYIVRSIADEGREEEVYCVVEPKTGRFTLEGGLVTGNCAYCTTENIDKEFSEPFTFLMDFSMLGVGVGGDCKGAGKVTIQRPKQGDDVHVVPDTREGWVELARRYLDAYVGVGTIPASVDYSLIRPYGAPIKSFGGTAAGPEPLRRLISEIQRILNKLIGQPITSEAIVDLFDVIGVCVVAGNVRRSAIIMFGEADDDSFLNLKNPEVAKDAMMTHRWASNNSVRASIGMNYEKTSDILAKAGEPGFLWLENANRFGRMGEPMEDARASGTNPCGEIVLEPYELCVGGKTLVQFDSGVAPIDSLVGREIKVWNGDGWSTVKPRVTGHNRELLRVTLSDGSFLDCTENHGWHIKPEGKRVFRRVEAKDLKVGDQVVDFALGEIVGVAEPHAYEMGFFVGDGFVEKQSQVATIPMYGEKLSLRDRKAIGGSWRTEQTREGLADPYAWLTLKDEVPTDKAAMLADKSGLPSFIFGLDRNSIHEFVAGYIDSDGTVTNHGSQAEGYRIYGSEGQMRDLQILLRRVNIDHATIRRFAQAGEETNYGVRNYDLWYCQIPSYECSEITTRLKKVENIGPRYAINNAHPAGEPIDRARKQKIVKMEKLPGLHTTYCFDEPENHMGVFANVLAYNCNLVETFPSRHATYDDYRFTLKYAYLYAKTVSLIPTHNARTNSVMLRNRRIGISQSGIIQSFIRHGRRNHLNWCRNGYDYIAELDRIYSEWLCVRQSKRRTTVKPSGTVSLLPGVTPGIHYEHAEYYYRTIRVAKSSPLVEQHRAAGYRVEDDKYDQSGMTAVIYFPIQSPFFDRSKDDVSMWEQLENAAAMQECWSDNAVSITVTFKPSEAKDLAKALELFESRLKTVSFLPLETHGYDQAPYITISREEFERASAAIKNTDLSAAVHEETPKFCDNDGVCAIPVRKRQSDQVLL